MRGISMIRFIQSTIFFASAHLIATQDVYFADDILTEGSECRMPEGGQGTCVLLSSCPYAVNRYQSMPVSHCFFRGIEAFVCCPKTLVTGSVKTPVKTINEISRVPAPNITDFECGFYFPEMLLSNLYLNETEGDANDFYRLTHLLREKQKAGNTILEVEYIGNLVLSLRWHDGQKEHFDILSIFLQFVLGGVPARYALSRYMALLGQRRGQENQWHCDGVLINDQWVLTAAHCFDTNRKVEVVRLGEYDYNNDTDLARPEDFEVVEIVRHPQYQFPVAYHDLALVKLSQRVVFSRYINPVCLPWGDKADINLIDSLVTLTGWGATVAGGLATSLLQEVNVTVFETTSCDASYSTLPFYPNFWPNGIRDGNICAGDELGGKDSCQGDSGGPIVYVDTSNITHGAFRFGKFTLTGIVAKGHGCGDANFPGIYMDIRHGPYLSWIKQIAFRDY